MSNSRGSFGNQCLIEETGWQMLAHLTNPRAIAAKAQVHGALAFAAILRLLQILEVL